MTMPWSSEETLSRVEHLVEACIGPVQQLIRPTPLAGALQIATFQILRAHVQSPQREEELTSMLLGAYVTATEWVLKLIDSGPGPSLNWGQYDKYGGSAESEGSTGADFALLVCFSDSFARASVFQAKVSEDVNRVSVHRIAPLRLPSAGAETTRLPEPQTLRLVDYGLMTISSTDANDLHWMHYCAYSPTSFFCIPLTQASNIITEYRETKIDADVALDKLYNDNKHTRGLSTLLKQQAGLLYKDHQDASISRCGKTRELIHLLAAGAATEPDPEKPVPGWLTLTSAAAIGSFKKTFSKDVKIVELDATAAPSPSPAAEIVKHLNSAVSHYAQSFQIERPRNSSIGGGPAKPRM